MRRNIRLAAFPGRACVVRGGSCRACFSGTSRTVADPRCLETTRWQYPPARRHVLVTSTAELAREGVTRPLQLRVDVFPLELEPGRRGCIFLNCCVCGVCVPWGRHAAGVPARSTPWKILRLMSLADVGCPVCRWARDKTIDGAEGGRRALACAGEEGSIDGDMGRMRFSLWC